MTSGRNALTGYDDHAAAQQLKMNINLLYNLLLQKLGVASFWPVRREVNFVNRYHAVGEAFMVLTANVASTRFDDIASAIMEFGRIRDLHFDQEIATGGPFVIIITLYRYRSCTNGITIDRLLEPMHHEISTAIYLVDRLSDWGYVDRLKRGNVELYRLAVAKEQLVEGYLRDCDDWIKSRERATL